MLPKAAKKQSPSVISFGRAEQEVSFHVRVVIPALNLGFVLQIHPRQLPPTGFAHQVQQAMGRHAIAQAFQAHVGDAVAVGIGQADLGRVGEIQPRLSGELSPGARRSASPPSCAQQLADLIGHRHAALFHQHHRGAGPAVGGPVPPSASETARCGDAPPAPTGRRPPRWPGRRRRGWPGRARAALGRVIAQRRPRSGRCR
jgi:hypothetical protein